MPKRKRTQQEVEMAHAPVPIPMPTPGSTPTRPKRTRSPKKKVAEESWDPYGGAQEREDSPLTDLDAEVSPKKGKKGGGKRKAKEPVVYTEEEIPPVERKFIDYKGRLGYACLNTILRETKPEPIFCSRTCRKDTIHKNGLDFAKDLGLKNTRDLIKLIEWNEAHHIRFMRISSEMFPFASHAELGYDLSYAKDELKAVGDLAKKLGHRLTTHPGQFTQLASPKEAVVDASVRELDYHCQMMRYMGLGKDSVIILHMGGVYNDKPTTIARFRENYLNKLTQEMRDRLVLENDEICYSVDDLLPICEELGVPIVLDYHHNWINPSIIPLPTLIPRLNKTWFSKSIRPKQHLSSPRPAFADGSGTIMDRRAHADRCYTLPEELGMDGVARDVDLMVEAKGKEQAVLMLYRIYGLESVEWGSLRPEKEVVKEVKEKGEEGGEEGVESPGKKRKTRGVKAKAQEVVDEDAEYGEELESPKKKTRGAKAKVKAAVDEDAEYTGEPGSPKKRTRSARTKKEDGTATSPSPPKPATKRTSKRKSKLTNTDATSLNNQEDAPVPVDGADVKDVEMEEHPEAVGAAVRDGDGCGVSGGSR